MTPKSSSVNLEKLSPATRKRVESAMNPRDRVMSLRFSGKKVDYWKSKAAKAGITYTEWVERACDEAASK